MDYILKYYKKSKYIGFKKLYYKEFNTYQDAYKFTLDEEIRSCDYDIYARVKF